MATTLFPELLPDRERDDEFTPLKKGNGAESNDGENTESAAGREVDISEQPSTEKQNNDGDSNG